MARDNKTLENISTDRLWFAKKSGIIQIPAYRARTDPTDADEFNSCLPDERIYFSANACEAAMKPTPGDPTENAQARRTALYSVLGQVPPGKVVSYGELAQLAGLGRAARWVGRTLSQLPADTQLPWHRVLGAGGRLSLALGTPSGDEQRARLRAEGVTLHNNRVDMLRHGWRPMEHSG
jgi:methylated-DNA-protein-cysteine methyltransferase-like protein